MNKKYTFVHSGEAWWLKLTNVDQVLDYIDKTDDSFSKAYDLCVNHGYPEQIIENLEGKNRIEMLLRKDFQILQLATIKARECGGNIIGCLRAVKMDLGMARWNVIKEYGQVYINSIGGHTGQLDYDNYCYKSELIFPHYTKEDIRISQFDGGSHYYAYIGNTQVMEGQGNDAILKWTTYKEVYDKALKLVSKSELEIQKDLPEEELEKE